MITSSPESLNGALETGFVRDILFQGESYSVGLNIDSDNLVKYLALVDINYEFIKNVKALDKKIILYHMGDEHGVCKNSSYLNCDLVIRNYFFSEILNVNFHPNIIWAPNGYRTGVGPRESSKLKNFYSRNSFASFLGWINNTSSYNNERHLFFSAAKECGNKLFLLASNSFAGGYNVGLYSAIMEDSIFAPCPAGNSPETIRLYDALELGCVPILLKHQFLNSKNALSAIGTPPFPQLDDWGQLPNFLNQMEVLAKSQPNKIQQLQIDCLNWWQDYKKHISNEIAIRISNLS